MSILLNLSLALFVIVALLMILVILMQRPKSEGLGAAFGGGMTDNLFGAQTTNVLTRVTGWLAGIFFFLTFALSVMYAHQTNVSSDLRKELMKTDGVAAPPAAAPGPSSAIGAPGTVTNPTPGGDAAGAVPAQPLTPADQAVGVTAPAQMPPASVEQSAAPVQQQPSPAQPQ